MGDWTGERARNGKVDLVSDGKGWVEHENSKLRWDCGDPVDIPDHGVSVPECVWMSFNAVVGLLGILVFVTRDMMQWQCVKLLLWVFGGTSSSECEICLLQLRSTLRATCTLAIHKDTFWCSKGRTSTGTLRDVVSRISRKSIFVCLYFVPRFHLPLWCQTRRRVAHLWATCQKHIAEERHANRSCSGDLPLNEKRKKKDRSDIAFTTDRERLPSCMRNGKWSSTPDLRLVAPHNKV